MIILSSIFLHVRSNSHLFFYYFLKSFIPKPTNITVYGINYVKINLDVIFSLLLFHYMYVCNLDVS